MSQREHGSAIRKARRGEKDYLAGVRLWLDSSPTLPTGQSYDDFVGRREARLKAEGPEGNELLVKADTVRKALSVGWGDAVAVAGSETTLDAVRKAQARQTRQERPDAPLGYAGIARLLGVPMDSVRDKVEQASFPRPVAEIGRHRLWLEEEVEAYSRGRHVPTRKPFERQHEYVGAIDVAKQTGMSANQLRQRCNRKQWRLVPQAVGLPCSHGLVVWKRDEVDAWVAERIQNG